MNLETTDAEPLHGELGVLSDDGEKVQCHVCGEWFLHLGSHTSHAHGLTADAYRERFRLMRKTKLGGPAWLAMRSSISAEHRRFTAAETGQAHLDPGTPS